MKYVAAAKRRPKNPKRSALVVECSGNVKRSSLPNLTSKVAIASPLVIGAGMGPS